MFTVEGRCSGARTFFEGCKNCSISSTTDLFLCGALLEQIRYTYHLDSPSLSPPVRTCNILYIFLTCQSAPLIYLYLLMILFSKYLMTLFKPLELRRLLLLHNTVCSLMSLYAFVGIWIGIWEVGDVFSMEHTEGILRHAMFVYWISKLVELLDTVYMVLRHKKRQISFLHVFHHTSITLIAEYAYQRSTWPSVCSMVSLNAGIHIIMYGYYGLTAVYPLHQFTWKRRITQLQMTQFVAGIIFCIYGYLYRGFCVYSFLYCGSMLALFTNFYYYAFIAKPRRKVQESEKKLE